MKTTPITKCLGLASVLCYAFSAFAQDAKQKTFPAPEDAVVAMVEAAKTADTNQMLGILGPEGQSLLSSGDPVMDQRNREVFLVAYSERAALKSVDPTHKMLYIGYEDWPFPIPLAKEGQAWRFDTAAGAKEILYRRIGGNELSTIAVCNAYVAAQMEYAEIPHDDKPGGLFAQKFSSTPGKQDGLYWKSDDPDNLSPLGELAAEAASEGYRRSDAGQPTPFQGYLFRILTSQGKSAKHGAKSYVVNGDMVDGFALIAFPAAYGVSGVMTFIVNQDGVVYQKDLGSDTAKLAADVTQFDPDSSWAQIK